MYSLTGLYDDLASLIVLFFNHQVQYAQDSLTLRLFMREAALDQALRITIRLQTHLLQR